MTNKEYYIATAIVAEIFATFINPKMRGPNFKWEDFPDLCVKFGRICLRDDKELYESKLRELEEYTRTIAKHYVEEAGLCGEEENT